MVREQRVDPAGPVDRIEIGKGQAVGEFEHACSNDFG
jgi:hypothetical protein